MGDEALTLNEYLAAVRDDDDEHDDSQKQEKDELERLRFLVADSNGDGELSGDELPAVFFPETHEGMLDVQAVETMHAKDKNHDGKLSMHEYFQANSTDQKLAEDEHRHFAKLDLDGDGALDLGELRAHESGHTLTKDLMLEMFERADVDGDGHITARELVSSQAGPASNRAHFRLLEWAQGEQQEHQE